MYSNYIQDCQPGVTTKKGSTTCATICAPGYVQDDGDPGNNGNDGKKYNLFFCHPNKMFLQFFVVPDF